MDSAELVSQLEFDHPESGLHVRNLEFLPVIVVPAAVVSEQDKYIPPDLPEPSFPDAVIEPPSEEERPPIPVIEKPELPMTEDPDDANLWMVKGEIAHGDDQVGKFIFGFDKERSNLDIYIDLEERWRGHGFGKAYLEVLKQCSEALGLETMSHAPTNAAADAVGVALGFARTETVEQVQSVDANDN